MDPRRKAKEQRRRALRRRRATALCMVVLGVIGVVVLTKPTVSAPVTSGRALDPTEFADGSCVAFAPTVGDRNQTVFLDAGHGGIDPGGVGTTQSGTPIEEATETLPVELEVSDLLRAEGFRVVVSRTTANTVLRLTPVDVSGSELSLTGSHDDVAARDICADDAHAQALVGIYYDAGASPNEAGSLTAYDPSRPFASDSLRLATLIQHDVVTDMDAQGWAIPDDGVQTDGRLGSFVGDPDEGGLAGEAASYNHLLLLGPASPGFFTTPSQMPGAVIEPLYLTDP
ncbi:MAG TPA: N-acetylmuramoyl-L-alanine amidase, partial [Acidimicrobiales bacterium]|nr:N-acetylmuramoyl-L-alanine amidase [Acidimicrobiales bacterium]